MINIEVVGIIIKSNQSNQFYLYTAIFENDSGVFTVQKIN